MLAQVSCTAVDVQRRLIQRLSATLLKLIMRMHAGTGAFSTPRGCSVGFWGLWQQIPRLGDLLTPLCGVALVKPCGTTPCQDPRD
jgi:hypothetical protein